jgi:hypothetical protein
LLVDLFRELDAVMTNLRVDHGFNALLVLPQLLQLQYSILNMKFKDLHAVSSRTWKNEELEQLQHTFDNIAACVANKIKYYQEIIAKNFPELLQHQQVWHPLISNCVTMPTIASLKKADNTHEILKMWCMFSGLRSNNDWLEGVQMFVKLNLSSKMNWASLNYFLKSKYNSTVLGLDQVARVLHHRESVFLRLISETKCMDISFTWNTKNASNVSACRMNTEADDRMAINRNANDIDTDSLNHLLHLVVIIIYWNYIYTND